MVSFFSLSARFLPFINHQNVCSVILHALISVLDSTPAVSSSLHNFPRTLCNLLSWLTYQPNLGGHFLWRVCPHTDCNKYRQTFSCFTWVKISTSGNSVASKSNFSPSLACLHYKRNNKPFHPSYLFDNQ